MHNLTTSAGGAAYGRSPEPDLQELFDIKDAADALDTLHHMAHAELYGFVRNEAGGQVLIDAMGSNRHGLGVVTAADNHGAVAGTSGDLPARTGWWIEAYYPGFSATVEIEAASRGSARRLHQAAFAALESGGDALRAILTEADALGAVVASVSTARPGGDR